MSVNKAIQLREHHMEKDVVEVKILDAKEKEAISIKETITIILTPSATFVKDMDMK